MKCRKLLKISPFMEGSYLFGKQGEEDAAEFLKRKGYAIVARNYRFQRAEIDLIARKGDTLAIVEVKTRSGIPLEKILEAVNRKKRERLIRAADHFIISNELRVEARFDIIWITRDGQSQRFVHIENAFYHF